MSVSPEPYDPSVGDRHAGRQRAEPVSPALDAVEDAETGELAIFDPDALCEGERGAFICAREGAWEDLRGVR